MGVLASFNLISAETYAHLAAGIEEPEGEWIEKPGFDIHQSWDDFHDAFLDLGDPLSLAIEGELRPMGGFDEMEDGFYLAYVSPDLARRIDVALREVPDDRILGLIAEISAARAKESGIESPDPKPESLVAFEADRVVWLRDMLGTLRNAYSTAAAQTKGLMILMS
jgi:hypothetical protein